MNLIVFEAPIHKVKNNMIKGLQETIYYTAFLDMARIRDYNHSILIPKDTILLNKATNLLTMEWDAEEINVLFNEKGLMNEFNKLSFKSKKVKTGLIKDHEIITELMKKTPVYYDKDSISQSLWLIELNKTIKSYKTLMPQNLISTYSRTVKALEKIKPLTTDNNYARVSKGFSFSGKDFNQAKDGFRIKKLNGKKTYEFKNKGSFYTLGPLGRLCVSLQGLWNR